MRFLALIENSILASSKPSWDRKEKARLWRKVLSQGFWLKFNLPKIIVNSVGCGPKTVFPRYIKFGLRVPTKDQNCGATL